MKGVKYITVLCLFMAGVFFGCSKEPGEGGKAFIEGRVWVKDYTGICLLQDEYPAIDERVYIIYGKDSIPDDDVRTSYNGRFRFEHLRKGKYTIYAISKADTCNSNNIKAVLTTVELKDNKEERLIGDLVVYQ